MNDEVQINESVIRSFHQMWDAFPGFARLINKKHVVIASNEAAKGKGFVENTICAKVGAPEIHKGCLMNAMFKTHVAQVDRTVGNKIRGWVPVEGHEDLMVHFTLAIPPEDSKID